MKFRPRRWKVDKNPQDGHSFPGPGFQPMWQDSDGGMTHSRKDGMVTIWMKCGSDVKDTWHTINLGRSTTKYMARTRRVGEMNK